MEKLSTFQPDIIVVDLILPHMDGWEMVENLRQLTESKKAIVIASYANVSETDQKLCQEVEYDDFFSKSIDIEQLFNQLEKYLQLEWIYDDPTTLENGEPEVILPPQKILIQLE